MRPGGNRFVIEYKPLMRRWHWKFVAANNAVMAHGRQEGYTTRRACLMAVRITSICMYDSDASDHVYEQQASGEMRHIKSRGRG